ncbi:hypothetical protein TUM17567_47280 [Citrobacter amalonaticus]|nr:hypothetical protein TUM17567_47280 [Citrobacter amalonaticus]
MAFPFAKKVKGFAKENIKPYIKISVNKKTKTSLPLLFFEGAKDNGTKITSERIKKSANVRNKLFKSNAIYSSG